MPRVPKLHSTVPPARLRYKCGLALRTRGAHRGVRPREAGPSSGLDPVAEFATEGAKVALFPRSELSALIGRHAPRIWRRGRRARSRSSSRTSTRGAHGCKRRASLCWLRRPTGRGASGRCTSPTGGLLGRSDLRDGAHAATSSRCRRRRVDQAASTSSSCWPLPRQRTTQSRCPRWMPLAESSSNAP